MVLLWRRNGKVNICSEVCAKGSQATQVGRADVEEVSEEPQKREGNSQNNFKGLEREHGCRTSKSGVQSKEKQEVVAGGNEERKAMVSKVYMRTRTSNRIYGGKKP